MKNTFHIRNYLYLLLFSLVCIVAGPANAQTFNFRNYNEDNGLAQGYIYHICQGPKGFLYLSTGNGFSIFDGYQFKTYKAKDGLAENFTTTHFIDFKGNTWIGHYQEGVTLMHDGKFTPVKNSVLMNTKINYITERKDSSIWIGTFGKGVFVISKDRKNIIQYKNLRSDDINVIAFGEDQDVIMGTDEGMDIYTYDASTHKLKFYQSIDSLEDVSVVDIVPFKKQNTYWVGTEDQGVYLIQKTWSNYAIHTSIKNKALNFGSSPITDLDLDNKNNLWISSLGGGIRKITFANPECTSYTIQSYTTKNGMITNDIQCVYNDKEGNTWFGTYGKGLIQLMDQKFTFYDPSGGKKAYPIYAIASDKLGNLWLGTNNGIIKFVPGGQQITSQLFNKDNGFENYQVKAIYTDSTGMIWIGTSDHGIYWYNAKKNKFISINLKYGLQNQNINCITGDGKNVYVGTTLGMYIYSFKKNKFRLLTTMDGLLHNNIYDIYVDETQKVWIASHGATLYYYYNGKIKSFKKIPGLHSYNINSITADKDGNIWFATQGDGVFEYNGASFTDYNVAYGLNSNYCYSVVCEKNGTVWVGHKNGVSSKKEFQVNFTGYDRTNGFLSMETNLNAVYRSANGDIWFGTHEGLIKYDKSKDKLNMEEPTTIISKITINNKPFNLKSGMKLPYHKYSIRFDFVGICLADPKSVKYQYILQGFETDWNKSNSSVRFAYYPKLEDGHYTFKVKSCNNDGLWDTEPTTISFVIQRPFWKKSWFYVLISLILAGLGYLTVVWRTRSLMRAKLLLEERVKNKTQQLLFEKENVERIKSIVEEKNRDITDSITYAKRIQEAILPSSEKIHTPINGFVYYRPRDIVSGDFYWYKKTKDGFIVAAVDCTGHGVPGAFMSLIGSTLLNEIVNDQDIVQPSAILRELDNLVIKSLKQNKRDENTSSDGMDMALCKVDQANMKLIFAGALRPLYIVRNHKLTEYKGSSTSIGGSHKGQKVNYSETTIDVLRDDMVYLFSDGYADQFGGDRDKKFMTKRMKNMFTDMAHLELEEQWSMIDRTFEQWKGETKQVDDVLVIGVKIQ